MSSELLRNIENEVYRIKKNTNSRSTACFLHPPTNSYLNDINLEEVKAFCISEITKSVSSSPSPIHYLTFDEPPQEFQLFFSNFIQANLSATESISDEVNRYSYLRMNIDMNFDVLQWWQNHTSEYPRLHKIAQKILSIPASSAASERVFSAAGNIITKKRNRIDPQTVNNLLFLNSVYKYE